MNAGIVFFGVVFCLIAILLLVFVVFKPKHGKIPVSRLNSSQGQRSAEEHDGRLAKATNSTVKAINTFLDRRGARYTTAMTLELAGIKMRPADFIIWVAAATGVAVLLTFLLELHALSFLMLLLVPLLAWVAIKVLTGKRESAFDDQLGDTLQLLSGGMRAGHSLMHAIDAAATDSDAPMSEELSRVVNETRLGRDTGGSLLATAARMKSEDFGWVAQAIEINREVGGDLAEVLDHVGNTIRDRNQIRRQVNSLSAEGRTSALVLFLMPVVVFVGVLLLSPGYFAPLFASPIGLVILIVSIILMGLGGLWLRAVIKIKF
jgi:tight adherence protein B